MKDLPVSSPDIVQIGSDNQTLTVKIAFLDVGQGDTIVISSPTTKEAIVVDCIDADSVLDYLEQEKIIHLRGIVITHLHDDHYSQVDDLLNRFHRVPGLGSCERLAFGKILNRANFGKLKQDSDGHQEEAKLSTIRTKKTLRKSVLGNMREWCLAEKRRYIDPTVQGEVKPLPFMGELAEKVQLMHPYAIDLFALEPKGLNNTSVVLHIAGPGSSALLMGDLEPEGWYLLQENHSNLRCDVLKFPHHGGAWDALNTKALLDAVQPSIVVISVGTSGEKYKHPNKEVFDVLSSPAYSHIRVLCTQATKQCCQFALNQRESVLQYLDQAANSAGNKRIGSRRGCPCAGTIIVELGERPTTLRPSLALHQDKIILSHFRDNHKCVLSPQ